MYSLKTSAPQYKDDGLENLQTLGPETFIKVLLMKLK
jgi:hypothetical protein